ncbi:MAG: rbsK [Lachnospiraceae bacterium]|nr:rbsK [Lachnospiraceae bacterium]
MEKKVLVVGSLNMDLVIKVDKLPMVGETILGDDISYIPGGKGANQACAIGRLGGNVTMLGCVGKDNFGDLQRKQLASCKVDVSFLKESDVKSTGTAVIYINSKGENTIVVIPGANNECDVPYLKQHDLLFQQCDYILLQMEIPYEAIIYTLSRANELGKTVILNPAPAPDSLSAEILKLIDYIIPNETELIKLSNEKKIDFETIERGAKTLITKGAKNVIVTMGDRGSLFVNEKETSHYPARKVQAVDTTAAGDCFNGAFVVGLAEGKTESEAIKLANIASSIVVTRKGAQISIPTREETDRILREIS